MHLWILENDDIWVKKEKENKISEHPERVRDAN